MSFKVSVKSLSNESKVVVKNQLIKVKRQNKDEFIMSTSGSTIDAFCLGFKRAIGTDAESNKENIEEAVVTYATIENGCDEMIDALELPEEQGS
jgi:ATP-dependent protease HslVU (ClpYQ) peptidase subunit